MKRGFTLIELSIVLVIVALLVAGIMFGQQMIDNARLRSATSQLESYNTAVYTFKNKFGCLPGDCTNSLTFGGATVVGYCDNGNGDGQLNDGCDGGGRTYDIKTSVSSEAWNFWYALGNANLIEGNYTGGLGPWTSTSEPRWATASPVSKFTTSRSNATDIGKVWAWYYNGSHYWAITGQGITQGYTFGLNMTPTYAGAIDLKMDDGMPNSGIVMATRECDIFGGDCDPQFNNPRTTATPGNAACTLTAGTPNIYNVTYNDAYCSMTIKTNF